MYVVYVISKDGKPLMPTTRCGHVRRLLKQKKARVVETNPFTIQLTYGTPDITQPLILGIDPGRTNIGLSAVCEDGSPVLTAQLKTRNEEVPKLMKKRASHRRAHRNNGRRKVRQRRAKAAGSESRRCQDGQFECKLPGYEEPVVCKGIKNKKARFNNRTRPEGWLTPTATQLLRTHLNAVYKIQKILPVTDVVLEANKFAFMKLDNPKIKRWMYQQGPLKGFDGVEDAVAKIQDGHCIFCNQPIAEYHHVVPVSKGGSDGLDNRVGLCQEHHHLVHINEEWKVTLKQKKDGLNKKYGALSVLNQIIPFLCDELASRFKDHFYVTEGWSTKAFRDDHHIEKDHHLDAYCIACSILENPDVKSPEKDSVYQMLQFRRHDRRACKQEMLNRKYLLDGKVVATNRHRAIEQESISLEEYRAKGRRTDNLVVKPHPPTYQRQDRIMPGAVFLVDGKRKVMTASRGLHNGKPNYYYFSDGSRATPNHCKLVKQNAGIVFA